jgi:Mrp family chromosome partitioning ATPase
VISSDPNAPGISDLVDGDTAVADVIMKDQMSTAHLIAAGQHVKSPTDVLSSQRLVLTLDALARSYDHVVIDGGAMQEAAADRFSQLAQTGILVVTDPRNVQAAGARQRLQAAGFTDVTMLVASGTAA